MLRLLTIYFLLVCTIAVLIAVFVLNWKPLSSLQISIVATPQKVGCSLDQSQAVANPPELREAPIGFQNKIITFDHFLSTRNGYSDPTGALIPSCMFRLSPFPLQTAPLPIIKALVDTAVLNPRLVQVYLNDEDCVQFIDRFCTKRVKKAYDALIPSAYKADILRLLLVYKYGGWYNDMGHIYLQSLEVIATPYDGYVCTPDHATVWGLHDAFFGAYPRHPIIKFMVNHCIKNVMDKDYGADPLDISGPTAIGRAFNLYFGLDSTTPAHVGNHSKNGTAYNIVPSLGGVIQTKFPGYFGLMYSRKGSKHYSALWAERNVFNVTVLQSTSPRAGS